jgi:hypothetical protein
VKALRLAYWNADGVRGRKLELEEFLSEHGVDIFLLNETHLESGRGLKFANYVCHRTDRPTRGRHSDSCPPGHRSLSCASLRSTAPGGYCHTPCVGNQTSEIRGGLPFAHTTLDRVREWTGLQSRFALMTDSRRGGNRQVRRGADQRHPTAT